ncbi:hypothetical protein Tco_0778864, partial [Tanacetum coccineum]
MVMRMAAGVCGGDDGDDDEDGVMVGCGGEAAGGDEMASAKGFDCLSLERLDSNAVTLLLKPNTDAKLGSGSGVVEGLVVVVVVTGTLTKVVDSIRGFRIESIPSFVVGEMNFETRFDTDELYCWTTGLASVRVTWASSVSLVVSASVMSTSPPSRLTFVTSL